MTAAPLRLGVCGLGRGFMLTLPGLLRDQRFALVAAADPDPVARARFERDLGGTAYETNAAMCADAGLDAVYVASPHGLHAEHTRQAVAAGLPVLVEKPMAVALEDAEAMVAASEAAGVPLVVGPSHAFDPPVLAARALIGGGTVGRVRMIQAMTFTDFLYRPRRSEELETAAGGGVVFSQAVHQVDVVRMLGGGLVRSVRAMTGAWDPARGSEGAYAALLAFEDGAFATLTYGGYGRFDSDSLCGGIGELGRRKGPDAHGRARRALAAAGSPDREAALKHARTYGGGAPVDTSDPVAHEHFGFLLACCERADLQPLPDRLLVHGDEAVEETRLPPPAVPRRPVLDELYAAVREGRRPTHDGAWGLASLEVCHGILRSAVEGRDVTLHRQVPYEG